jgi:hypothetical protein
MIMKLKEKAMVHGGCRASGKKNLSAQVFISIYGKLFAFPDIGAEEIAFQSDFAKRHFHSNLGSTK